MIGESTHVIDTERPCPPERQEFKQVLKWLVGFFMAIAIAGCIAWFGWVSGKISNLSDRVVILENIDVANERVLEQKLIIITQKLENLNCAVTEIRQDQIRRFDKFERGKSR